MNSVLVLILHKFANKMPLKGIRSSIYRLSGVRVGLDVFIGEDVLFDRKFPQSIFIGDRTAIGARTIITSHQNIPTSTGLKHLYPDKQFETIIESDVWIMPGVIVTPGVRIGHHSVIATGVVVHKDIPPNSLVVGNGFRIPRTIEVPPDSFP